MLDDFQAPSFNLTEVADAHNLEAHFINATGLLSYEFFKDKSDYDFVDWNYDADTQSELTYLSQIAKDAGFETYVADYGHLGVYVCRMLIPGMSDIYPVDDLLWSNNNEGAYFREALLSLDTLTEAEMQEVLENLEVGEYNDMTRVAEFIGVITDANTAWASVQLGELKAMLHLALGEFENAKDWVNWCTHMAILDDMRANLYRCLNAMLEIKITGKDLALYRSSLAQMYTHACVVLCEDIIEGKERFYGLHSPGLSLEGFEKHQTLLAGYAKVQEAKRKFY